MSTVYLAGPINGCSDAEAMDWREFVKSELPDWTILDPMVRDYRGREADNVAEIVEGDKYDISISDVVLLNAELPSWGTPMEFQFAYELGVPVVAVCPGRVSPWITYHADIVLVTLKDAIYYLRREF